MSISVDPDWWKSLFDEVYLLTDARSVCDHELTRREIRLLSELLPFHEGCRVLDLCGGHGRHSLELARQGLVCTVADYSQYLLDYGRGLADGLGHALQFKQADARNTGLSDSCFDHVIIMGNSLGYQEEEDADRQILDEAFRVLKEGGRIAVDVTDGRAIRERFKPNAWHEIGEDVVVCRLRELHSDRVTAREMVLSKSFGLVRDRTYSIRVYTPELLASLLSETGFADVRVHTDFSFKSDDTDVGFMNHRMLGIARK